jgi:predicted DNA-binding transcriptional regulator AlpA
MPSKLPGTQFPKPKRFFRKKGLAERSGCDVRTIDRMTEDGRLPKPIYRGRFPLWVEAELDAADTELLTAR